jgi:NAD(P) transhydrogenase subunit alpha
MPDQQKTLTESAAELANRLQELSEKAANLAVDASNAAMTDAAHGQPFLITGLTVFVLACFVGYHVVWRVTPALHSPLMGITNAISSVIIVGAILALGTMEASGFSKLLGFLAVMLASVNIFGGFIITRRMLHMFKKKG